MDMRCYRKENRISLDECYEKVEKDINEDLLRDIKEYNKPKNKTSKTKTFCITTFIFILICLLSIYRFFIKNYL